MKNYLAFLSFLFSCLNVKKIETSEAEFKNLQKGFYSGIREKKEMVIKDKEEFLKLWKDLTSIFLPSPEPPDIDFNKYILICVFMGEKPTGGYEIEIKRIFEKKEEISVYVKEVSPGQNCIVTMALTQPYHIVIFKKTKKKFKFYFEEEKRNCS
ncbi:MAG: protease complex subunit PrcB family protein [Candidatus Hydrothermales bacterium]